MKEASYRENNFKNAIGMDMIIIATGPYWVAPLHLSVSHNSQTAAISLPILHASCAASLLSAHCLEIKPVAKDFPYINKVKINKMIFLSLIFLPVPPPDYSLLGKFWCFSSFFSISNYLPGNLTLTQTGDPTLNPVQVLLKFLGTLFLSNGSPQPGVWWSQFQQFNAIAKQNESSVH